MIARNKFVVIILFIFAFSVAVADEEKVDLQVISQIRAEGMNRSQVMETLSYLTDVYGPRLTGTPQLKAAMKWCVDKMTEWGLKNAAVEPWGEFGRGWTLEHLSIHMTAPVYSPIIAYPKAWTGGTDGVVKGKAVLIELSSEADMEKYKGKLKGAIVLSGGTAAYDNYFKPAATRLSAEQLNSIAKMPIPQSSGPDEGNIERQLANQAMREKQSEFLKNEGVAVILQPSRGGDGTLFVGGGGSRTAGDPHGIPQIVVALEHYNRMVRMIGKGADVELEIDVKVQFHEKDLKGYNVVAEIPGTDPELKDELVMLGGHIDSWHASTGATDNAAGVAIAMEAVRILKTIGVQPRRTIRVGFWDGEEQGLLGSGGYVKKHFSNGEGAEKDAYDNFSVYFNFDNGTGKIRGIYMQGNDAARPIFEAWFRPFRDLDSGTLSIRSTGGTDHLAFQAVGLPAYQFIQDTIAYSTRTHHTNMDNYDHIEPGDLMQSATIMASFVYNAAMRDEKMPRKAKMKMVTLSQEAIDRLLGEYEIMPNMTGVVTAEGGNLYVEATGQSKISLIPISETRFLLTVIDASVEFIIGPDGKASEIVINMPGGMKIGGKKIK